MIDLYDIQARAVYDRNVYTPPTKTGRKYGTTDIHTPTIDLLMEFMARPETACHIPCVDIYHYNSTRASIRRWIDSRRLPIILHPCRSTLTVHLNKEALCFNPRPS